MKKTKFHRLIALVLAFVFLLGSALTVSAAVEGEEDSTTDKTLEKIKEYLNVATYEDYMSSYADVERATTSIVIPGTEYAAFEKGATGEDVKVVTTADGVTALYTPDAGQVTWKVPAGAVTKATKYSVVVEYWPDAAKSSSIERSFKINGKIPFTEARYLSIPKIWRSTYSVAKVTDPKGNYSLQQLYDAAIAAGFSADSTRIACSGAESYLELAIPDIWTVSMSDFVNRFEVRFFERDFNNNEVRPSQQQAPEWCAYELRDADGFYAETLEFVLMPDEKTGEISISLEAIREPMTVKAIILIPHEDLIDYETYRKQFEGVEAGSGKITIQAEYMNATSSQNIYPLEDRSDAANMPSDTTRTVLNTIGGDKWQTAGQWVRYSFKVDKSGMYHIASRYRQNMLDGMYVCRALRISSNGAKEGSLGYYDGGMPFREASQIRFNYSSDWQSMLMNNGTTDANGNLLAYEFYFEEGVEYSIEMEVTLGSMGDIIHRVETILDAINADYLEIIKLTGTSPDQYRDYNFFTVMPDVMIDMHNRSEELYKLADELAKATGEKSSNVATLEKIAWTLERISSDEDEVATYLDQLKGYIGTLGTWLGDAKTQPLQLDYVVIQPSSDDELPPAKAGFFASLLHEVKSFIMSFFRNYDNMSASAETDAEAIDVWIATGRDQAQVLRTLISNDFTNQSTLGTAVNLKLINGGALLPSVLAGIGPDVYLGIGEGNVINYAIRGALLPIERMEGFADYALEYKVDENFNKIYDENGNPIKNENSKFNEAAMLVLGLEDADKVFHYYGLPMSQDFSMMFVRDDILADLGVDIPRTWDDVLAAVPVLQANNMQIGMHKNYQIFLYQMGGELFADGGMRINLDSNLALEAFETMCNNFTMYSFPISFDFANRFRTGEMPIGFGDYNDTYNKLTVFATEIKGLWEFLPLPGIEHTREDGSTYINNVSVATTTAICMMNGCDQKEKAWEFMKWYTGAECQVKYSNEMVAILGPSAKPACANKEALREMPWTAEEYKQIAYQFSNLASIPDYPGTYIIGRYTNFAFLAAYNDKKDPVDELQSHISTINKEITRKREEFGLETLELGQTLAEKRLLQVEEAYAADTEKMDQGKLDAAKLATDIMKNGIRDEDAVALSNAADAFAAVDATAFAATITALRNAVTVLTRR